MMSSQNDVALPSQNHTTLLDQKLEDRFLRALLDYPKLYGLVESYIQTDHFSTKHKAIIYASLGWFLGEYKQLPSFDELEMTIEQTKFGSDTALAVRKLEQLKEIPVPSWEYIIKNLDRVVKAIAYQKMLYEVAHDLQAEQVEQAENRLLETIRSSGLLTGATVDDLQMTQGDLLDLAQDSQSFCCPTRIYALDKIIQGLYRRQVFLIMAALNVGKSWSVVHICNSALLSGKHVLYITCEMSRINVLQRVIQNISGAYMPTSEHDHERVVGVWNADYTAYNTHTATSLLNVDETFSKLEILRKYKGVLSVREYASGTCTHGDIEKEIALFDVSHNKLPDVVIVDGLMDLKHAGGKDSTVQRNSLTDLVRNLRRLASDYDLAMVTTHQANREALEAETTKAVHTGEAIGISQVADMGITLSQTNAEQEQNRMRMYIMRSRHTEKNKAVEIFQNLTLGQFCQASRPYIKPEKRAKSENSEMAVKGGEGDYTARNPNAS